MSVRSPYHPIPINTHHASQTEVPELLHWLMHRGNCDKGNGLIRVCWRCLRWWPASVWVCASLPEDISHKPEPRPALTADAPCSPALTNLSRYDTQKHKDIQRLLPPTPKPGVQIRASSLPPTFMLKFPPSIRLKPLGILLGSLLKVQIVQWQIKGKFCWGWR